ncbi:MAG: BREX-1 system phosphatase PglZ type B [Acidobacteria bacterium]|nr:BREX-1 system phosphatase PglZ type B [Acidobacteriota bacterium]
MADILQQLVRSIRAAAVFNPDVQVRPRCILWPDGDRQWEGAIPRLQAVLPELFVLGGYDAAKRSGPAIWLRCVIARKAPNVTVPEELTPILYLPGIRRQDLRAVESCPDLLKPLAELQYSGTIWSQVNSKDWTILAFLKSDQGGLGLDVAQDHEAKQAMQLALSRLLDEDAGLLQGKRLDKDYFNTLLTGGDPARDLLHWLDQGEQFRNGRDENAWRGFVEVCKSQLAFDPENDGDLQGAELLANHKGPWLTMWERYCEAAKRYPNIPVQIRKCTPPNDSMFWMMDDGSYDGWPQWNEDQEKELRGELLGLSKLAAPEARKTLLELEKRHGRRRTLVWAELGESPLACALESLGTLANVTGSPLASGTANEIAETYRSSGWRADDAVLRGLACVTRQEDFEAVKAAIRAVYLPWAEDSARYLQKLVEQEGYPAKRVVKAGRTQKKTGECVYFVDGLRLDVGRRLSEKLRRVGMRVEEVACWAALPTVTATGKPAVTPVAHLIEGQDVNADFEPCVAATGQSLKGGYYLRKLLAEEGWQLLDKSKEVLPEGPAWCEAGNIDHEGHERGWKLAKHLEAMLGEIAERIERLLAGGFETVRVVTDHGWLLMPGGLPKTELPSSLAENTWGRCAALKPGASSEERLYPWYWNPQQEFALADGISCYRAGMEYAHGGVSVQECLTLELIVTLKPARLGNAVQITDIIWKGLRCRVAVEGDASGLILDLRTQAANEASSMVMAPKPFRADGTSSVVVEDEEMEGRAVTVVVVDAEGQLVCQRGTVIGKEGG